MHPTKYGFVLVTTKVRRCRQFHSIHYSVKATMDGKQLGYLEAQEVDVRAAIVDDGYYKLEEVLDETADLSDLSIFLYGVRAMGLQDHVYEDYRKWKTFTGEFRNLAANFRYSKPTHRNRWSDWDHKICYISHLEVDAEYRNGGIGSLLIEAMGKRRSSRLETFVVLKCSPIQGQWRSLKQRSPESWNMYVTERNQLASFYRRHGFHGSEQNVWMVSTRAELASRRRNREKRANLRARSAGS